MPNYKILLSQAKELAETNKESKYKDISILANISALLYQSLDNINWLGFYIKENGNLVLGPFQGKVACTFIKGGCGVCGRGLNEKRVYNVPNVLEFEGHIACDSMSRSELVIPIIIEGEVRYIFDIDAPVFNRFDEELEAFLKEIGKVIEANL